ncbi:MAG: hypothetical protein Q9212_007385 [Teloschistes hypoglaucus]
MDRITGTLWGWKESPLGEASYLTGSSKPANHAGCKRPRCNKRSLHQWETRWDLSGYTGTAQPQLPRGERLYAIKVTAYKLQQWEVLSSLFSDHADPSAQ